MLGRLLAAALGAALAVSFKLLLEVGNVDNAVFLPMLAVARYYVTVEESVGAPFYAVLVVF
jgi:hypothetical protein